MTMTHTQEYDTWFRETGQFLPPCDLLDPHSDEMEKMKQFGAGVFQHLSDKLDEENEVSRVARHDKEKSESALAVLKEEVLSALAHDNPEKTIRRLCES